MARWAGTTTQRGLGHQHQIRRKRAFAAFRDGDPCPRCGQPMYHWQKLELDHLTPRALGGGNGPVALAHAWCNRSAGGKLGNRIRRARRTFRTSRAW